MGAPWKFDDLVIVISWNPIATVIGHKAFI